MNPVNAYQAGRVNGASPARLVILLYDRLLSCIEEGRVAMREGRQLNAQVSLTHAQRIAGELLSVLNPEAGEFTENLKNLYIYVIHTIERSKHEGNADLLAGPAGILENLRGGWVELEKRMERGGADSPAAVELVEAGTGR